MAIARHFGGLDWLVNKTKVAESDYVSRTAAEKIETFSIFLIRFPVAVRESNCRYNLLVRINLSSELNSNSGQKMLASFSGSRSWAAFV